MEYVLEGLEPQNVLRNFWDLSQIYSRRADNTQGISDYLAEFGRKLGLRVEQDETTNVIIYKPATPGYEQAPTVMLAAHMDMICAANPGVKHDFDHEPLRLVLDGDRDTIHADGTTLGADDGLGIAFILSVLESGTIAHPAIEAVFTTNEETDMKGAWNLHYEKLSSRIILSLDATRLSLGGAGELEMELFLDKRVVPARGGDVQAVISVDGLIGGHGNGPTKVYFDGHMDTVLADPREWSFDPWSGDIQDGLLRGRGSVDMKSSAAAAVYGAYAARELGYAEGKTIYVSCSVMEEDYEGAAVDNEFRELNFRPDYAVICEPTRLRICNGHFGRALFEVAVKGVGIHASRHQLGDNALNKIVPIIQRVEALGKELLASGGEQGSIASTKLATESVSINSTPGLATLTIDRRTTPEDTEERLSQEMDRLCADIPDASWSVVDTYGTSWTGREMVLHNLMPAWKIPEDHHLVRSAWDACTDLGLEPVVYRRSGFTNGWVTCGRYQIPTIVFGAGDEACCHIVDEACPTDQILRACAFYTRLEAAL